jgi:hypothetical protein
MDTLLKQNTKTKQNKLMKKLILALVLIFALAFPLMATAEESEKTIDISGSFTIDVDFDLLGSPLVYGDTLVLGATYNISESMCFDVTITLADLIFEEPLGADLETKLTFNISDDLVGEVTVNYDIIDEKFGVSFVIKF